jgi:hypothetical protein
MNSNTSKDGEEFLNSPKKKIKREIDNVYYLLYDDEISLNEKREILEKLDRAVEETTDIKKPEAPEFKAENKGGLFPILVAASLAASTAIFIFLSFIYFGIRKENLILNASTYFTTESAILEEFKRESEEKLRQKDEKINFIRSQLNKLDRDKEILRQNFEEALKVKEEELKVLMDEEINREKLILESSGASSSVIQEKISDFASKKIIEYARTLEEYKQEMEVKLQIKEIEIERERKRTKMLLVETEQERQQLVEEMVKHEEELRVEYERERGIFVEKATVAEQKLQTISKLREQERLISDQVVASYSVIQEKIESFNFNEASDELYELREMILDETFKSIPSMEKRRKVDLFIVDSLIEMIETKSSTEDIDTITKTTELLFKVRDTIINAEQMFELGNHEEAKRLYYGAIDDILTLSSYRATSEKQDDESLEPVLSINRSEEESFEEVDILDAIDQYKKAATLVSMEYRGIIVAALDIIQESLVRQEKTVTLQEELVVKQMEIDKVLEDKAITVPAGVEKMEKPSIDQIHVSESRNVDQVDVLSVAEDSQAAVQDTKLYFLGTLSSITTDFVVVEPLVDIDTEKGSLILFRRRLNSGTKIDVAMGKIDRIIEGKITASIDTILLEGYTPKISDLVYTEIPPDR